MGASAFVLRIPSEYSELSVRLHDSQSARAVKCGKVGDGIAGVMEMSYNRHRHPCPPGHHRL